MTITSHSSPAPLASPEATNDRRDVWTFLVLIIRKEGGRPHEEHLERSSTPGQRQQQLLDRRMWMRHVSTKRRLNQQWERRRRQQQGRQRRRRQLRQEEMNLQFFVYVYTNVVIYV